MIGNCSPSALNALKETEAVPPLEIGQSVIALDELSTRTATVIDIRAPLSSFHYQVEKVCPTDVTCFRSSLSMEPTDVAPAIL